MAYRALYNKYRPQTFDEVVGQQGIVRTLKNAIATGKIAHAYLFSGPRGTGKTTMARLFAKALNCEEGRGFQCNHCSNCLSITEGSHPDVVEIDAASNNGVEQVRDLIDKVRYAPIRGRYKVYIIDEVHMMTTGAFNALLKTLEEPPEQVIFVMATTEPFKVPPTILSRLQRFDFSKIPDQGLKNNIVAVLEKEGVSYEDKAVDDIVSLADGGMRDALSILEQVLAYSGEYLREEDVMTIFGLTSTSQKIALLKLIVEKDVSGLLDKLNEFVVGGVDIKRLNSNLLDLLKDALIYQKTRDPSLLSSLNQAEAKEVSSFVDQKLANSMIRVLLKAQTDFKNVSNARSLFELTLLELASVEEEKPAPVQEFEVEDTPVLSKPAPAPVEPIKKVAPKASDVPLFVNNAPAPAEDGPLLVSDPSALSQPGEIVSAIDIGSVKNPDVVSEGDSYSVDDETLINIMVLGSHNKDERRTLNKNWAEIKALKGHPDVGNLATLLSEGHPFCLCKEALLLNFDFTRLAKKANIKANQQAISAMIEQLIGRKVFVYALDRFACNAIYKRYTDLEQLSKLPNKKEISLKLPEGE